MSGGRLGTLPLITLMQACCLEANQKERRDDLRAYRAPPYPQEYRTLFEAVGWQPCTPKDTALANSLHGVVAVQDGETISMGRAIGDRGFFYIQDSAVHPEYQGQGVTAMCQSARWRTSAPPAALRDAFVGVFAMPVSTPFYRQYGFEPHTDALTGLWTMLHKTD